MLHIKHNKRTILEDYFIYFDDEYNKIFVQGLFYMYMCKLY